MNLSPTELRTLADLLERLQPPLSPLVDVPSAPSPGARADAASKRKRSASRVEADRRYAAKLKAARQAAAAAAAAKPAEGDSETGTPIANQGEPIAPPGGLVAEASAFSPADLAQASGLSRQVIADFLKGRLVSATVAATMAEAITRLALLHGNR